MLEHKDVLLDGMVAVVTGGGQGIGEGVVRNFAAFGAKVVIADKNEERANRVAEQVTGSGGEALAVRCDIRVRKDVEHLFEQVGSTFAATDILVNNAGGVRRASFLDLGVEGWRKHIDLNLYGLLHPTELAARQMIAAGRGGSIINIASIEAVRAAPLRSVYGACKAAMLSLTETLALEFAEHGIRVNAIAPDTVVTPGMGFDRPEFKDRLAGPLAQYVPLGHPGDPDDIAGACVYLSSRLGRYTTGATLHVDGGTWAAAGWMKDSQGRWETFRGLADLGDAASRRRA
jgi:NAD(P)-dependent dehydrogenase (short-subunit alcohol dehydrogenase family)